jgi:hypothetical protein
MATTNPLLPGSPGSGSALRDFLGHSVIYEKAGGVMPRELVVYGFYGSVAIIVTGLVALMLPSAAAISNGGFFLLLKSTASGLDSFLQGEAIPAIVCGAALVALDVYLTLVPTSEAWRMVIVGQTALGGIGGTIGVLFLALVALNLAIWIVIIGAIIGACLMMLGALASG